MSLEIKMNRLSGMPTGATLILPERLTESGAMMLVGKYKTLVHSGVDTFVLDLRGTKMIGDAGLGALSHLWHQSPGKLFFLAPREKIKTLFQTVGLTPLIVDTLDEALHQIKEA